MHSKILFYVFTNKLRKKQKEIGYRSFYSWQLRFPLFMHAEREALVLYKDVLSNPETAR